MAYMELVDCNRSGGAYGLVGVSLRARQRHCTCSVVTTGVSVLVSVLADMPSPWYRPGQALRAQ